MIIYESSLEKFIENCSLNEISKVILKSAPIKGFNVSPKEMSSWENSLPFIASALENSEVDPDVNVAIEYNFNVTKNRMDFLVYGIDEQGKDNVVIIELKQWSEVQTSNKPNYVYTYGGGGLGNYEHPSYQAYRYQSILKGFNAYVQDNDVKIASCSYLHNMDNIYDFIINDFDKYGFLNQSPVFLKNDAEKLASFVNRYVKHSRRKLLYEIDDSVIRPSSNFSKLMFDALKGQPMFTLDDQQENAVSTIVYETREAIKHNRRKTIIIKGGPGTGKSIVAINALGQLINPTGIHKAQNTAYCTTNFTPRTLFSELLIGEDYRKSAIKELFKPIASFARAREFDYDCILLDEAHRAFKWKFGQGVKKDIDLIDRLFYASRVNVFFIDEDQCVTKDDYLTIKLIKDYARRYGSEVIESEDLTLSSQFRVLGGKDYIDFIDYLLGYSDIKNKFNNKKNYDFKVFDTATELWNAIHAKQETYPLSRLLSGYTHDWVSQNDSNLYDFNLDHGKFKMKWNKKVSYSYINDPTQFDHIGCIHTIQGVDMDYAGVIIGKDLIYRDGRIVYDQSKNAKTDKASGIRNASKDMAEKLIRNTYKVLLTRAIHGTYIYCEDKELNEYIKSLIK